jgi:hypothetical protein
LRPIEKAGVLVLVGLGALVLLSEYLGMPRLMPLALALLGLVAVFTGVDTAFRGSLTAFDRHSSRREYYTGLPAYLIAAAILLIGAALVLFSVWDFMQPGAVRSFLEGLWDTNRGRGMLLMTAGVFPFLFGLVRVLAGSAYRQDQRSKLVDFGFRLGGVAGMAVGLLLMAGGAWLAFM